MMIHSFVLWDRRKACQCVAASAGRPRPQDTLPSRVPNPRSPPRERPSSPAPPLSTPLQQQLCGRTRTQVSGQVRSAKAPQNQAGTAACPASTRLDTPAHQVAWASPHRLALCSGLQLRGPRALLAGPHGCVGVTPVPRRHGAAKQWGHVADSEPPTLETYSHPAVPRRPRSVRPGTFGAPAGPSAPVPWGPLPREAVSVLPSGPLTSDQARPPLTSPAPRHTGTLR